MTAPTKLQSDQEYSTCYTLNKMINWSPRSVGRFADAPPPIEPADGLAARPETFPFCSLPRPLPGTGHPLREPVSPVGATRSTRPTSLRSLSFSWGCRFSDIDKIDKHSRSVKKASVFSLVGLVGFRNRQGRQGVVVGACRCRFDKQHPRRCGGHSVFSQPNADSLSGERSCLSLTTESAVQAVVGGLSTRAAQEARLAQGLG